MGHLLVLCGVLHCTHTGNGAGNSGKAPQRSEPKLELELTRPEGICQGKERRVQAEGTDYSLDRQGRKFFRQGKTIVPILELEGAEAEGSTHDLGHGCHGSWPGD